MRFLASWFIIKDKTKQLEIILACNYNTIRLQRGFGTIVSGLWTQDSIFDHAELYGEIQMIVMSRISR